MKWRIIAVVLFTASLTGCEESFFIGEWFSPGTGAKYRLEKNGECRYINDAGLGKLCEWDELSERKIRIRISEGRDFVEAEGVYLGQELMTFWPGKVDSFVKQN